MAQIIQFPRKPACNVATVPNRLQWVLGEAIAHRRYGAPANSNIPWGTAGKPNIRGDSSSRNTLAACIRLAAAG